MLLNDKSIRALCNVVLGPSGQPMCPKCSNSMQNATPEGTPNHRRCATCKTVWLPKWPMLDPFSEGKQDGGVISYGLSHAGYDLRLGTELLIFKNSYNEVINPKRFKDDEYRRRVFDVVTPTYDSTHGENGFFVIPAHSYALGASFEYIRIPRHIKGRCVGKSTLARCGILINTTPLEPNWHGHLTIEISNISPCPAMVFAREGIAQLEFETLCGEPESDYGEKDGKYQGQSSSPVAARVKE